MAVAFAFHGRRGVELGFPSFIIFSLLTTFKLVDIDLLLSKIIIMTMITTLFGLVGYRVSSLKIFNYMREESTVRKPVDRFIED
jgi:hypothetical protein